MDLYKESALSVEQKKVSVFAAPPVTGFTPFLWLLRHLAKVHRSPKIHTKRELSGWANRQSLQNFIFASL